MYLFHIVTCIYITLYSFISDFLELIDTKRPINNSRIGKYFSELKGTHYMPNEMLANEYPDYVSYEILSNEM